MFTEEQHNATYPLLADLADPLKPAERDIVGREHEIRQLMAAMNRPELCNALLLGDPGIGKTAVVQAIMMTDTARLYLEVDPARMITKAGNAKNMAATLKGMFDEAERFVRDEGRELVMFIDEFHQLPQLSDASVEAIKPVLAASGVRGIRIIAATTYDEFHIHIAPNQPLVQRLQRINLSPPDQATTVRILAGMAERYEVADEFHDDHIFRQIYEYTERYMPAAVQPRKSILVLDAMVGWHRLTKRPMDRDLLADVLQESSGVNVAFRVDGAKIKHTLDEKVYSQDLATRAVAKRLQLSVADLNDKTRPEASFLFAGSTGVGKMCVDSTPVPVYSPGAAGGARAWKRHGDLVPGDFVFNRRGQPVEVLGVFEQPVQDVYRVSLTDGRSLDVGGPHLWTVYPSAQALPGGEGAAVHPVTLSTETLQDLMAGGAAFWIPMNGPVQWAETTLEVDPYESGVRYALAHDYRPRVEGESGLPEDIAGSSEEVEDCDVSAGRLPQALLHGSVEQRWQLVKGLFDVNATIDVEAVPGPDGAEHTLAPVIIFRTMSEALAGDLRSLLFSLGVSSQISSVISLGDGPFDQQSWCVEVQVPVRGIEDVRFFNNRVLREAVVAQLERTGPVERTGSVVIAPSAVDGTVPDLIGIAAIERLAEQQPASCIYIADEEHLYQAGEFVVTHNTELTKQLASLLFGDDQRHLIRFDMTEYASDASLEDFRTELTRKVWDISHAVLLFDEIEKASSMVTRLLLQVLDDGRLSDANHREVSFLNTYIVLTTNAGTEIFKDIAQYAADDTGSGEKLKDYERLIRRSISSTTADNRFPPELVGRIDTIVPFQPLSLNTQRKIIKNKLGKLSSEVLIKHNVRLEIDERVLSYLVDDKGETDSNAGGARIAVARMTDEVTTAVATRINENPGQRRLRVDVVGDLVSEDKARLRSDAYIEVSASY